LPEAIATAQQARELALAQNNKKLAATLENQLRRYEAGKGVERP
jgi:hypothetical protein